AVPAACSRRGRAAGGRRRGFGAVGGRRAEVDGKDLADVGVDVEVLHRVVRPGELRGGGGLLDVGDVGVPLAAQLAGGDQRVEVGREIGGGHRQALRFGAEALQL